MCNHYRNNARAIKNCTDWSGYTLRIEQVVTGDIWPQKPATVIRRSSEEAVAGAMQWGSFAAYRASVKARCKRSSRPTSAS